MVTVPPGHWIKLPAASQEKPDVESRFVNGSTVSDTTGPLPLVTFCDSRLPNPSYVQLNPHSGPVVAAAISRPRSRYGGEVESRATGTGSGYWNHPDAVEISNKYRNVVRTPDVKDIFCRSEVDLFPCLATVFAYQYQSICPNDDRRVTTAAGDPPREDMRQCGQANGTPRFASVSRSEQPVPSAHTHCSLFVECMDIVAEIATIRTNRGLALPSLAGISSAPKIPKPCCPAHPLATHGNCAYPIPLVIVSHHFSPRFAFVFSARNHRSLITLSTCQPGFLG